jgi:hypothetical protein
MIDRLWAVFAGLVSGAFIAVCGAFVQADRFSAGRVLVPFGAAVAVATALVWQLWLGRYLQSRLATVSVAVAWVVTTLAVGMGKVGEGVVLADETRVTWYLGLGAVAVATGASLPILRDRTVPQEPESD